ncbi:MAG TPA: calcium-binding protein, partial [Glaciihabitans sp.]|nr:calcium-binding protein [Glaciihabitans sp.]
ITFYYNSNNTVEGGAGDDWLKMEGIDYSLSQGYMNTLAGGAGNDRMESGGNADTYLFNRGDGQDVIYDYDRYGYGRTDRLVFGAGIAAGDVTVRRSGNHLVLTVADPANPAAVDKVTIENWDTGAYRVEQVVFADGTTWDKTQLGNLAMTGTDGADLLTQWSDGTFVDGKGGDDTITSGNSNATIYGGAGNDTITDSSGNDTIDGGSGDDVITDTGSGTNVLRGGDGNDRITFGFLANNTVEGGAGNDLLKVDRMQSGSWMYSNTFAGGIGNDRIESSSSADTYLFNRGDGQDTINDNDYNGYGKTDRLVFGAGIAAGDVTVRRSGNHLVLTIADPANPAATDQVTIENWGTGIYRIEQLVFADGTTWTASELSAMAIAGTDGADTIWMWNDSTFVDGKGGNDTIYAGGAAATIYGGDGNDTINSYTGNETVDGGAGDDVIRDQGSGTNVLRGGDGRDTITFYYNSNNTVEGGAGDDWLKMEGIDYSLSQGYMNTLAGGAGNDRME